MKQKISKLLPFVTIAFVIIMLCSLCWGWLNPFFYILKDYDTQGIDYYSIPKSFLNLLEHRSIYDTWGGTPYVPYATWYLAHPAFSVFVGSWFSFFSPKVGYALFTLFSLVLIIYAAFLISKTTNDGLKKRLSFFILLCAFPTYSVLFTGNMHAPIILSITFILLSLFEFTYTDNYKTANQKLVVGLLLSFFTKPIVVLMLPLLLLLNETRKTTFKCIGIYCVVSILFLALPVLNPQAIGYNKLMGIVFDFDFIKENLNIYKNQYVLNDYMKDNSIHWLNLIAQSDYKLMHINIFSLPVFVDGLLNKLTPSVIYKIPIYICFLLSIGIAFIENKKIKLESALLLVMSITLTFFLSYNTVWEYQYAAALPIVALLPILKSKNVFYKKQIPLLFFIGLFFCFPSFYWLNSLCQFNHTLSPAIIRANRVIPALLLFLIMMVQLIKVVKAYAVFGKLKEIEDLPTKLFFD